MHLVTLVKHSTPQRSTRKHCTAFSTGATLGVASLDSSATDEPAKRRGFSCQKLADSDSSSLPSGHILLLTHHGALSQGVCLQGGPGKSKRDAYSITLHNHEVLPPFITSASWTTVGKCVYFLQFPFVCLLSSNFMLSTD